MLTSNIIPTITREYLNGREINNPKSYAAETLGETLYYLLIDNTEKYGFTEDVVKRTVKYHYLKLADETVTNTITPWTIASILKKKSNSSNSCTRITTIVKVGDKEYIHDFTEECVLGLLIVLNNVQEIEEVDKKKEYSICIEDVEDIPLVLKDIIGNYIGTNGVYTTDTKYGKIGFNDLSLIQGIITAARWTNTNPCDHIMNLKEGDNALPFMTI